MNQHFILILKIHKNKPRLLVKFMNIFVIKTSNKMKKRKRKHLFLHILFRKKNNIVIKQIVNIQDIGLIYYNYAFKDYITSFS